MRVVHIIMYKHIIPQNRTIAEELVLLDPFGMFDIPDT